MHWTFEVRRILNDAPWPISKRELLEYLTSSGSAPPELIEALQDLDIDPDEVYQNLDTMWEDLPRLSDYYYDEDEE